LKWTTLRHNGVAFPPPYDYRGLVVRIKNEKIKLTPEQEEMLMAWAKKKDTPYVLDAVFQKNFLADFVAKLDARFADITLADIDFTELHAIAEREKTANLSPEEKKARSAERKREREALQARYGTALLDGNPTEVGAYLVEPPGILMGRGQHPLRGKWKARVQPEDVTLNLDEDAPIPPAPEGHHWKEIVHEHDAMWIASWWDDLAKKRKYIWLAETSHLRQERDKEKYLKAAKLETSVDKVRAEIAKRMDYEDTYARAALDKQRAQVEAQKKSLEERLLRALETNDATQRTKLENALARVRHQEEKLNKRAARIYADEMKTRQLATVCYLIDRLAMRVGDEKDEDEADTVGASTLRVEHVRIGRDHIEFDFLGKDSVEWHKALPLNHDELLLARNLQDLTRGKKIGDQIFDKIDSTHVNKFLSSIVPGLTAKVFRTYHATHTVRDYLAREGNLPTDTPNYRKEYIAKLANLEAAIVCNHKRTPPKNWQENLAKREVEVQRLRAAQPDVEKLRAQIAQREKNGGETTRRQARPGKTCRASRRASTRVGTPARRASRFAQTRRDDSDAPSHARSLACRAKTNRNCRARRPAKEASRAHQTRKTKTTESEKGVGTIQSTPARGAARSRPNKTGERRKTQMAQGTHRRRAQSIGRGDESQARKNAKGHERNRASRSRAQARARHAGNRAAKARRTPCQSAGSVGTRAPRAGDGAKELRGTCRARHTPTRSGKADARLQLGHIAQKLH
jgi:DNA topoisomerase-1